MKSQPTESASNETGQGPVRVTVRYWAAARAAAGRAEDHVDAATVAEAVDQALRTHGDSPRFASVLSVSSLLVGDQPIGSRDPETVPVVDGDVIEVLPPFAGG